MIKLNLYKRYIGGKIVLPAIKKNIYKDPLIPLKIFNGEDRKKLSKCLASILEYRNAGTGAGRYRTGLWFIYKLIGGSRQSLFFDLSDLKRLLQSVPALDVFERVCENIYKIEEMISPYAEQVQEVEDEVSERLPFSSRAWNEEIIKNIFVEETIILDFLAMIDSEIDVVLNLFGLTRYSKIQKGG